MHSLCNRAVYKLLQASVWVCSTALISCHPQKLTLHTHSCSPEVLLLEGVRGQSVIQTERRFVENLFLKIVICVSGTSWQHWFF